MSQESCDVSSWQVPKGGGDRYSMLIAILVLQITEAPTPKAESPFLSSSRSGTKFSLLPPPLINSISFLHNPLCSMSKSCTTHTGI